MVSQLDLIICSFPLWSIYRHFKRKSIKIPFQAKKAGKVVEALVQEASVYNVFRTL